MAVYSLNQQVYFLSLLTNSGALRTGEPAALQTGLQSSLAETLDSAVIKALIGDWSLVWGPYIYQHPLLSDPPGGGDPLVRRDRIDNAFMVFQKGDVYVVAMAATNPLSAFDWIIEDFAVHETVDWPVSRAPSGIRISRATALGLDVHLRMPFAAYGQLGPTVLEFLQNLPDKAGKTVIVVGYSLGGALAPALALNLFGQGGALYGAGFKEVLVLPVAGASPGNKAFARFYEDTFPPLRRSYDEAWNAMVHNSLDVVPHAWQTDTLAKLPTLYGDTVPAVVALAVGAVVLTGMRYISLHGQAFEGTRHQETVKHLPAYLLEASYQHIRGYVHYFNLLPTIELDGRTVDTGLDSLIEILETGFARYLEIWHQRLDKAAITQS